MHKAILERLRADRQLTVARLFAGTENSIRILAAYRDDTDYPLWIGKTSAQDAGRARLRKENAALSHVAPWSQQLRTPAVVAFEDDVEETCLIQTGIPGFVSRPSSASTSSLTQPVHKALAWLEQFEQLVPLPQQMTLAQLTEQVAGRLQPHVEKNPAVKDLAQFLRSEQPMQLALQPLHGDFWHENVFVSGAQVGVIDWDELRSGLPLHDALTLLLSSLTGADLGHAFDQAFFSASAQGRYLRKRTDALGVGAAEARFCFYAFAAERLSWKKFSPSWLRVLENLGKRGFPVPVCFA